MPSRVKIIFGATSPATYGEWSGEQEIIATATEVCSEAEWKALCKALENVAVEKINSRQQSFRLRL
jgi:hypothetical protein